MRVSKYKDHEDCWQNFWRGILTNSDTGELDLEQLKRELFDYYRLMGDAAKVYDNITGGRISKVNTDPNVVCDVAYDHYEEMFTEQED